MSTLFIGGIFPNQNKEEILEKSLGNIQNAANNFQLEIIKGIEYWNKGPIDILNAVFVGSWPKFYKDKKIKEYNFNHIENSNDFNIGFYNVKYFKHLNRSYEVKKNLFKWLDNNKNTENKIYVYSYHVPFLFAISMAKKRYKNIKICLIVPDLPQYMNLSNENNIIKKILKTLDTKIGKLFLKDIDTYIFLTKYMKDEISKNILKYDIVEGIVPSSGEETEIENKFENKKIILYTGTLDQKYGILKLINSIKYLENENFELWICGEGNSKERILDIARKESRIKYKGMLKVEEVKKIQKKATLLVNPRSGEEEYTKYSFPSKTLEYMVSGTPILMNRLKGVPEEYYKYMFVADSDDEKEWAKQIKKIFKMKSTELEEFGKNAKEFVKKEKNFIKQGEKIFKIFDK